MSFFKIFLILFIININQRSYAQKSGIGTQNVSSVHHDLQDVKNHNNTIVNSSMKVPVRPPITKIGHLIEDTGVFLRNDDHRLLSLPTKKIPSVLKGCDNATKLIAGVLTRPSELSYRNFIRKTWGLSAYRQCQTTKLIFLLGNSDDASIDKNVIQEASLHQDILLLDYHESYNNVSRKIYGFFQYLNDHCPNVKCIIKVDGDSVVNLAGMEALCDTLPNEKHLITGKVVRFGVNRRPGNKHYTPFYVWPENMWPTFIGGFTYILSGVGIIPHVLVTLQKQTTFLTSENFRYLAEDIIFAGVVPAKSTIRHNNHDGLNCCNHIEFWWHKGKPITLAVEARNRNPYYHLVTIAANRRLSFPEFSNKECYLQSFGKLPNETRPVTLSQMAEIFNPSKQVPTATIPVIKQSPIVQQNLTKVSAGTSLNRQLEINQNRITRQNLGEINPHHNISMENHLNKTNENQIRIKS